MNNIGPGAWRRIDAEFMFARSAPEPNSGCWLWDGDWDAGGYGRISYRGKKKSAHILSFELHRGAVPDGLELDHICKVRCCINPHHLEPVTRRVNMSRSAAWDWNRNKTHCPAGHPYEAPHLYVSKSGKRHCLTCAETRRRDRRQQAKAQAA